jgi:hypothetical protein
LLSQPLVICHYRVGQFFQVHQSRPRDLRAVEGEPFQAGQPFQMLQSSIRDLNVVEVELCQAG